MEDDTAITVLDLITVLLTVSVTGIAVVPGTTMTVTGIAGAGAARAIAVVATLVAGTAPLLLDVEGDAGEDGPGVTIDKPAVVELTDEVTNVGVVARKETVTEVAVELPEAKIAPLLLELAGAEEATTVDVTGGAGPREMELGTAVMIPGFCET